MMDKILRTHIDPTPHTETPFPCVTQLASMAKINVLDEISSHQFNVKAGLHFTNKIKHLRNFHSTQEIQEQCSVIFTLPLK